MTSGLPTQILKRKKSTYRCARHVNVHRTTPQINEVSDECGHWVRRRGVSRCEAIRFRLIASIERARDGSASLCQSWRGSDDVEAS